MNLVTIEKREYENSYLSQIHIDHGALVNSDNSDDSDNSDNI